MALGALAGEVALAMVALTAYGLVHQRTSEESPLAAIVARLSRLESVMDASRIELKKLADIAPLSDQAKGMIFREKELEAVQEVVNACMVQQNYEQAAKVIDRLEQQFGYKDQAERLRDTVRINRDTTIEGRIGDAIARIDQIIAARNWERACAKASGCWRRLASTRR